jgi:subtilisin family serine protease
MKNSSVRRNDDILCDQPAWELGYTGKKVVVTILDDGIQYNHPDLSQNYDPLASKVRAKWLGEGGGAPVGGQVDTDKWSNIEMRAKLLSVVAGLLLKALALLNCF